MSLHSACFQDMLINKMADVSSWFYRGEGNDTLVVGLRDHNLVLRLKKKPRSTLNGHYEAIYSSNYLENIHKLLDFSKFVVLPLMDSSYVPLGRAVRLPNGFADKLDKLCEPSRPKHRIHKGIATQAPYAMIMPDLCFLPEDINCEMPSTQPFFNSTESLNGVGIPKPTFSVEIKPKCGFLPSSPYIKKANSIRRSVCYYCMLQGVKVAEGKYERKSCYCPVNLLSGDPKRVFHALQALVSDPQNNLRVFKDGFPIFTEEIVQGEISSSNKEVCCPGYFFEKVLKKAGWHRKATVIDSSHSCDMSLGPYSMGFMETILQILIEDSNTKEHIYDGPIGTSDVCMGNGTVKSTCKVDTLPDIGAFGCGGVLAKLKQVQRMDDIDVDGLHSLYFKVKDFFGSERSKREESTVDGPYNSELWQHVAAHPGTDTLKDKPIDEWTVQDMIVKLCKFSVASTAKDCSIMLTFRQVKSQPHHLPYIQTDEGLDAIAYYINLVDLDPKEFDRVLKYYKDHCRTAQHYLQNNQPRDLSKIYGGK